MGCIGCRVYISRLGEPGRNKPGGGHALRPLVQGECDVNQPLQACAAGKRPQIGLWLGLCSSPSAELLAGAGFDWLIDRRRTCAQQRANGAGAAAGGRALPGRPVVRPPWNDAVIIKQLLDVGAQTLLIPMIKTPNRRARCRCAPRAIRRLAYAASAAPRRALRAPGTGCPITCSGPTSDVRAGAD
ncbi:aldolase/citrate lyase family protein [Serratia ureilytica]